LIAIAYDLAHDFLSDLEVQVPGVCGFPHFHEAWSVPRGPGLTPV